jgi:hypothetical protein
MLENLIFFAQNLADFELEMTFILLLFFFHLAFLFLQQLLVGAFSKIIGW